jgi:hypothetical protein
MQPANADAGLEAVLSVLLFFFHGINELGEFVGDVEVLGPLGLGVGVGSTRGHSGGGCTGDGAFRLGGQGEALRRRKVMLDGDSGLGALDAKVTLPTCSIGGMFADFANELRDGGPVAIAARPIELVDVLRRLARHRGSKVRGGFSTFG